MLAYSAYHFIQTVPSLIRPEASECGEFRGMVLFHEHTGFSLTMLAISYAVPTFQYIR